MAESHRHWEHFEWEGGGGACGGGAQELHYWVLSSQLLIYHEALQLHHLQAHMDLPFLRGADCCRVIKQIARCLSAGY